MLSRHLFFCCHEKFPRFRLLCYIIRMDFDFQHLRAALTALDSGSFRHAASVLGVRPATVGANVRQIEKTIGFALFIRRRDGVHPTRDGSVFLDAARIVVEEMEALGSRFGVARRGKGRRITIGFYTSVSTGHLRATLTEFRRRHGETPWKFINGTRRKLLDGVEHGLIDIAIVTAGALNWHDARLDLWSERCIVALPAGHPLAEETIVEWSRIRNERFLASTLDPGPEIMNILRTILGRGSQEPHIVTHDTPNHQIRPFVSDGKGVMIDCESCVGESLPGIVYRAVRNNDAPSEIRFAACWRRDNPNPSLWALIALLRERHPDLFAS